MVSGQTEIALIDAQEAAYYMDMLVDMELRASKIIDTNSGYGIVLSGGLEPVHLDVRSFIIANQPLILEYVEKNIVKLIVSECF